VKKCLEAIDKATSPSHPGYKLREAFESSLTNLAAEMSKILSTVCQVDSTVQVHMRGIANTAARLWLQLGTQRFRVLVIIPDQIVRSMQGTQSRSMHRGLVELVIRPELRRAGNSIGGGFDQEEIISGCKGDYSSFQS
jgi:hypothetical protein